MDLIKTDRIALEIMAAKNRADNSKFEYSLCEECKHRYKRQYSSVLACANCFENCCNFEETEDY